MAHTRALVQFFCANLEHRTGVWVLEMGLLFAEGAKFEAERSRVRKFLLSLGILATYGRVHTGVDVSGALKVSDH